MNSSLLNDVNSSSAISARAKEKIRMQAQRYQRGSLSILKRKSQPDVWAFRYYAEENGHRVYKRKIIGTVIELPKRRDAEEAVSQLRIAANAGAQCAPLTVGQLVAHYLKNELPGKAYSTIQTYTEFLKLYIVPKWGSCSLSEIVSIDVENWIKAIEKKDGKPASPGTRAKIRNIMSAVFAHARRYGWASSNPIKAVRVSAERLRDPEFLTSEELQALIARLPQRERTMVLLDAVTGLRRGELMELRWQDIDCEALAINVTRSIWRNVVGNTKTKASRKPVPLHPAVAEELRKWKAESIYQSDADYLFPSIRKNGTQPLQPDMILRRHIRPVLAQMGVKKRIGWHSFRHGLATMFRQKKVDLKVAQNLLRHANSRILIDFYQHAVDDEKREAQNLATTGLVGDGFISAPSETLGGARKKRSSLQVVEL